MTANEQGGEAPNESRQVSDGLHEADEVTVAANSDLLAQIREEAQELTRDRTTDRDELDVRDGDMTVWRSDADQSDGDNGGGNGGDDVTSVPVDESFDPSLDPTAVMADGAGGGAEGFDAEGFDAEDFDESSDATEMGGSGGDGSGGDGSGGGAAGFDPSLDPTAVLDGTARSELLAGVSDPPASDASMSEPVLTRTRQVDDGKSLIGSDAPPPTTATYWLPGDESEIQRPTSSRAKRRGRVPAWLVAVVVAMVIIGASVAIALLVAS